MTLFKPSRVLLTAVLLCYNELTTKKSREVLCVLIVSNSKLVTKHGQNIKLLNPGLSLFWCSDDLFSFLQSLDMSYRNSYKWRTLHLTEMIMNNQAVRAVLCFYKDNAILIVSPSICCSFSQCCSWMGIKTVINAQKAFLWKRTHLGCL